MNAKEVQKLGIAMASVSGVTREQVDDVMSAFGQALDKQTSLGMGADDTCARCWCRRWARTRPAT
jgi:flagellar motor switch protein FliG